MISMKKYLIVLILLIPSILCSQSFSEKSEKTRLYDAVLGIDEYMKSVYDWENIAYEDITEDDYGKIGEKEAFASYKALADSGDVRAQLAVSYCYENALGVKMSRKDMLSYLEKAMEKQYAPAICRYCELMMKSGTFTTTDAKVVSQILTTSLSSSFSRSYIALSQCYRLGFGVKENVKSAIELLEKAKTMKGADIGEIDGEIADIYFSMYQEDKSNSDNAREALSHYTSASELENENAELELVFSFYANDAIMADAKLCAYWYAKSKESYSKKANKHIAHKEKMKPYWEERAAKGDIYAMYNLADYYDSHSETREPNLEKCIYYLKKAADSGNEKACYDLYIRYFSGDGVTQNFDEAKKYRRKCGEYGGNAEADIKRLEEDLALKGSVEKGNKKEKKTIVFDEKKFDESEVYQEALLFYLNDGLASVENWKALYPYVEKEAFSGNSSALKLLGDIYFYGFGVEGDMKKGLYYYRLAAALQNDEAMMKLAECYEDGIAVPFDSDEAMAWYMSAAFLGSSVSEEIATLYDELGLLKENMFENKTNSSSTIDEDFWWTPEKDDKMSKSDGQLTEEQPSDEQSLTAADWSVFGEPTVITEDNASDYAYDVVIVESAESVASVLISSKMLHLPTWSNFCTEIEIDGEKRVGEEIIEAFWRERIEDCEDLEFKIYGGTFLENAEDTIEKTSLLVFSVCGKDFSGEFSTDYVFDFAHSDDEGYKVFDCKEIDAKEADVLNGRLLSSLLQDEEL